MDDRTSASAAGSLSNLAQILAHNVREHVEVVLELLSGTSGVSEAARTRLLAHIAEEERSNSEQLNALLVESGSPPPRELRLMRDHSEMLLDILDGQIPQPLGIRLLHHFAEEHTELLFLGREDNSVAPTPVESPGRPVFRLSLGSLRKISSGDLPRQ